MVIHIQRVCLSLRMLEAGHVPSVILKEASLRAH